MMMMMMIWPTIEWYFLILQPEGLSILRRRILLRSFNEILMEEKEQKPDGKSTRNNSRFWQCPICGVRIWLSSKKRHI